MALEIIRDVICRASLHWDNNAWNTDYYFAILAAWAFSKSSPELYNWLHNHKVFGKYLNNWEKKRVFPKKGRLAMCFVMIISSISIYFTLSTRALLIAVICFVLILIWAFRYPGSVEEYERRVKEGKKIGWLN